MKKLMIPPDVLTLLRKLEARGHEAYVVGGCVRDACMGRTPHDWDITTNSSPLETMEAMKGFPVIETGLKHGTVTVLMHQVGYEITTYRVDGDYSDGRHPDKVVFVSDLSEDLRRRDFTMNAMAYNPKTGLVDLFDGQGDIKRGQIRCVGEARERFTEDVLRILRALRFAAVFDFDIEENTSRAVYELKDSLPKVSMERITTEFRKMVMGKGFVPIARSYAPVLGVIIPEILPMVGFEHKSPWHHLDLWEHVLLTCEEAKKQGADEITMLAAFFHDIGKPDTCSEEEGIRHFKTHALVGAKMTDKILRRLKFDNETREKVSALVLHHDDLLQPSKTTMRRLLSLMGEEQLRRLMVLIKADLLAHAPAKRPDMFVDYTQCEGYLREILEEEGRITLKNLKIGGQDLRSLGVPEGKTFGVYLNRLLDLVLEGQVPNEREELIKLVKIWLQVGKKGTEEG